MLIKLSSYQNDENKIEQAEQQQFDSQSCATKYKEFLKIVPRLCILQIPSLLVAYITFLKQINM